MQKPGKHISLIPYKKAATLKQRQEHIVETLPGVGPKLAKSLLIKFKNIKQLFMAREEELRKIDKMGEKKAEKIIDTINHEYE